VPEYPPEFLAALVAAAGLIVAAAVTIEEPGSLGQSLGPGGAELYCQRSAVARELAPFSNPMSESRWCCTFVKSWR